MNRYATLLSLACLALSTLAAAQNSNPWPSSGPVGIGTNAPQYPLDVQGPSILLRLSTTSAGGEEGLVYGNQGTVNAEIGVAQNAGQILNTSSANDLAFKAYSTGNILFGTTTASVERVRITNSGKVGIGTSSPAQLLEVNGNTQVDGSLQLGSSGIQITSSGIVFPNGGGTQSAAWNGTVCGGDFAESVDVSGDRAQYGPGDVLVIDPENVGAVAKSAEAYSSAVVGVYSTRPGVVGRRQKAATSPDEVPMALVGIVPIKVSAENGPIHPGDLLVSASIPGYAMKGTDRSRMMGAVIGKSFGNLSSRTGVIEVGVSLH